MPKIPFHGDVENEVAETVDDNSRRTCSKTTGEQKANLKTKANHLTESEFNMLFSQYGFNKPSFVSRDHVIPNLY